MKITSNIIKTMALLIGLVAIFTACEDNSDPMAVRIDYVNSNITSIDKNIASPGDEVTVTGNNLDEVYKIMLNENVGDVEFEASETTLTFTIPTSAPLGDVVIINFFFSGKGLAQRPIEIMSPPVILGFSPQAASGGEECDVFGAELYKAVEVYVGDTQVEFTLIDDKQLVIGQLPVIANGDKVKVIDGTGAEIESSLEFVRGTEILVTDFENSPYLNLEDEAGISSNGNMDGDTREFGNVVHGPYYTFIFTDNGTSWGGNIDFFIDGSLPSEYTDNSKIYLYIDIKVSDELDGRIMVQGPASVYGDNVTFTTEWQTFKLRLSDLYTGYGNDGAVGETPTIDALTAVKVQPPAGGDSGNFGKTISIDNIKFIVEE